ncbi:MAG: hypothetical protein AAGI50_02790 [Pseudomonadota bacterium]
MEYPLTAQSPFAGLLRTHNSKLALLSQMRGVVRGNAAELAQALVANFDIQSGSAHWAMPGREREIAATLRGNGQGSARSYDPWNGAWRGPWLKPGQTARERRELHAHIWDETQHVTFAGHSQYVQPVTQSRTGFKLERDLTPQPAETNIAINVWSPQHGLTGWVGWGGRNDPHIAYLLNPHTLIWVMQFGIADRLAPTFAIFFEWVAADHQAYGISGRFFDLSPEATRPGGHRLTMKPPREAVGGYTTYRPVQGTRARVTQTAHTPGH